MTLVHLAKQLHWVEAEIYTIQSDPQNYTTLMSGPVSELKEDTSRKLSDLVSHRMTILNELARYTGHKLVPQDKYSY